jgi:hypothetical protein
MQEPPRGRTPRHSSAGGLARSSFVPRARVSHSAVPPLHGVCLAALDQLSHCGDPSVSHAVDPVSGEVAALEEVVGSPGDSVKAKGYGAPGAVRPGDDPVRPSDLAVGQRERLLGWAAMRSASGLHANTAWCPRRRAGGGRAVTSGRPAGRARGADLGVLRTAAPYLLWAVLRLSLGSLDPGSAQGHVRPSRRWPYCCCGHDGRRGIIAIGPGYGRPRGLLLASYPSG